MDCFNEFKDGWVRVNHGKKRRDNLVVSVDSDPIRFRRENIAVTLFVDHLPIDTNNGSLRRLFNPFGRVVDVFVPWKIRKGLNFRFGFVRFESYEEACSVVRRMDRYVLKGQAIKVKIAENGHSVRKSLPIRPVTTYIKSVEVGERDGTEVTVKHLGRLDGRSFAEVANGSTRKKVNAANCVVVGRNLTDEAKVRKFG